MSRPGDDGAPGAGADLGEYRLLERLGGGGMGVVHRAVHAPTGAVRAVKVVRALDAAEVLRFRREVEATAAAGGHPAVVRIHATGEAGGRLWYAMDLAEGGSLAARLAAAGPLPPGEVARLGAALARGLAHLHARGVVHRDLKPENVLFDGRGAPLLADLGLAAVRGAERLTETGALLGTPAYMAPEQALGERARVDARTDVHGLGAVLYAAAAGRPPFAGGGTLEVLDRVARATPAPLRAVAPAASAGLEAVVGRCLEKDPARRYPSAAALAEDLEAVLAGRAPRALGAGRGRAVVAALALGAAALAVLAAAGARAAAGAWAAAGARGAAGTASGGAPAPVVSPAPVTTGPAPAPGGREVELADLLAREEEDAALRALEEGWRRSPGRADPAALAPWVAAALLLAEAPAAGEAWRGRGPALAEAADLADAVGAGRPPRASRLAGSGAGEVVAALAALERVSGRWAGVVSRADGARSVLPLVADLVAAAEDLPDGPVGAALRVRAQRGVLAVDGAFPRLARGAERAEAAALLERAAALAPRSRAHDALAVTAAFVAWWGPRGGARPAPVDAARLAAPYDLQAFVGEALAFLAADAGDAAAVEAGLARWPRLLAAGQRVGLLDAAGSTRGTSVTPERTPHADLAVAVLVNRSHLLLWRAWWARRAPDAAAHRRASVAAAEELVALRDGVGELHAARAHLLAGDAAAARGALGGIDGGDGRDWQQRLLEAEAAVLEGDLGAADAGFVAVEARLGDQPAFRAQVALARAAVAAQRGDHAGAEGLLAAAARELAARDGDERRPQVPWRTLEETRRQLAAARGGWRAATAGRPWAD